MSSLMPWACYHQRSEGSINGLDQRACPHVSDIPLRVTLCKRTHRCATGHAMRLAATTHQCRP